MVVQGARLQGQTESRVSELKQRPRPKPITPIGTRPAQNLNPATLFNYGNKDSVRHLDLFVL